MTRGGTNGGWRKARALALRVHGDACVMCGDKATEVDHIIEVHRGGTDEVENLQPLCHSCHKAKTSRFNSERMKKPLNNGFFWSASPPPTLSLSYLSPSLTVEPPIAQRSPKKAI